MQRVKKKQEQRFRRAKRTRSRVHGTSEVPRLSVFRSQRHLSAQLIDDVSGRTLASASDLGMPKPRKGAHPRSQRERAVEIGERLAERAIAQGIRLARFDRGRYRYHGRIAALAEGARKAGLKV